ncbi:MAG: CDP-alcohol phosphatidyltransferase family protein [Moraxellaceae bacterium]|nr:MAG: CDP-alcohol phosphatidyltransferase family protein [Moraxellaceae bacterium]
MIHSENKYTIPNFLSAYRILAVPVIVWTLVHSHRELFVTLICINLITDIIDGWIARKFNMTTEFGARLDSIADIGTFVLSIVGFWIFETTFVMGHALEFWLIFGVYGLAQLASILKFRRPTSLHLYTSKVLGYIQGVFIFTFFVFGNCAVYFYFMVVLSIIADLEVLAVVLSISKPISNGQSIFHTLKRKANGTL